ncbi:MAG: ribosome assembly cofactor RimP, partial [Bacteroidia bacterium]|nr:ribosome assembly cofactor RimP [Bacteroidia bacterium]
MDKIKISQVIEQYLKDNGLFLVDISISKDNDIEVVIESYNADVKIGNCIDIDRIVSENFNRDDEDYALTVTSA